MNVICAMQGLGLYLYVVDIIVVGLSASLAATGYGMMLGTVVRSYDQAYVFGAVSVLIFART